VRKDGADSSAQNILAQEGGSGPGRGRKDQNHHQSTKGGMDPEIGGEKFHSSHSWKVIRREKWTGER